MKSIAICSSVSFYRDVVSIANQLRQRGFDVIIPKTAELMLKNNDFDPANYTNQVDDSGQAKTKGDFIREMFDLIPEVDAILVINNTKHGKPNYIGANVFLEMGVAFYFRKKIYLLSDLPSGTAFDDELKGMSPTCLHGEIERIT